MAKLLLFVFVSHLFVLPEYARELMILNLGWGNIYPLRLYTVGLPALYVFHLSRNRGKFRTPHLGAFAVLFVTFVILESLPHRTGPAGFALADMVPFSGVLFPGREAHYSFAVEQFYIYFFFLVLVNFGLKESFFYRVVDYSLYAGLITCLVTYMGYAGLIDLGTDYVFQDEGLLDRPSTLINANNISYIASFSMLLLVVKQLNERMFSPARVARDISLMSLFTLMSVINSTRGALVIALIMLAYYCLMLWRSSAQLRRYVVFLLLPLALLAGLYRGVGVPGAMERTNIYQRSFVLPGESTGVDMRLENIRNAVKNFKEHPFLGVGYFNAAKSDYGLGTRTNNQFLQTLAAGGVFYLLIYLFYNYRFLVVRARFLARPEVALSVAFQLMYLTFRRPTTLALLSLSAYVAIYFHCSGYPKRGPEEPPAGAPAALPPR
ncbi:MAG: O-antigen ligase family protein [Nitrospirota bacterium]